MISPTVRASVIRLITDCKEAFTLYHPAADAVLTEEEFRRLCSSAADSLWLPEGYEKEKIKEGERDSDDIHFSVLYSNEEDNYISFSCHRMKKIDYLGVSLQDSVMEHINEDGISADLYLSTSENVWSRAVWTCEDTDIVYILSGYLTRDELLKMIKSAS